MQIANSFDRETIVKIVKGAVHTFVVSALIAGGLAVLNFLGQQDFGNPLITALISQFCGVAYNTLKEYRKGEQYDS